MFQGEECLKKPVIVRNSWAGVHSMVNYVLCAMWRSLVVKGLSRIFYKAGYHYMGYSADFKNQCYDIKWDILSSSMGSTVVIFHIGDFLSMIFNTEAFIKQIASMHEQEYYTTKYKEIQSDKRSQV